MNQIVVEHIKNAIQILEVMRTVGVSYNFVFYRPEELLPGENLPVLAAIAMDGFIICSIEDYSDYWALTPKNGREIQIKKNWNKTFIWAYLPNAILEEI